MFNTVTPDRAMSEGSPRMMIIIFLVIIYGLRAFISSMWGSLRLAPIILYRMHKHRDKSESMASVLTLIGASLSEPHINGTSIDYIIYGTSMRELYIIESVDSISRDGPDMPYI